MIAKGPASNRRAQYEYKDNRRYQKEFRKQLRYKYWTCEVCGATMSELERSITKTECDDCHDKKWYGVSFYTKLNKLYIPSWDQHVHEGFIK